MDLIDLIEQRSTKRRRRHPLYMVWQHMIARCYRPSHKKFARYGARGITVCDRWRQSFTLFLQDMGNRPAEGRVWTLERIDNDKGYEPGNCRWATYAQQNRNLSRNRWLTVNGVTLCAADWARRIGVKRSTITLRLQAGWSVEEAVTTPSSRPRLFVSGG